MNNPSQISTLDNGLRVISLNMPGAKSIAISVWVETGTRNETAEQGGLSHLLEHMAFKGTTTRSAQEIAEQFDAIGGNLNAFTSMEHTVYHARVLRDDMPFAIEILGDILRNSVFDPTELEREKQVVLQEIAMHRDTPEDLVFDHFTAAAFPNQPIGSSVLGRPDQVLSFTSDHLHHYVEAQYRAPHMVIAVAGNVDHNALLAEANRHFASFPSGPQQTFANANYRGGNHRETGNFEQLQVVMGFPAVSYQDPDYRVYQMLSILFGGGMSSRLFQEVREKRGLCYHISAFFSPYADCGLFGIISGTGPKQGRELVEVISHEFCKLQNSITEEEMDRARNQLRAGVLMSAESVAATSETLGRHTLCYGKYLPPEQITEEFARITRDDLNRVLEQMQSGSAPTFAALGPGSQELPDYETLFTSSPALV